MLQRHKREAATNEITIQGVCRPGLGVLVSSNLVRRSKLSDAIMHSDYGKRGERQQTILRHTGHTFRFQTLNGARQAPGTLR